MPCLSHRSLVSILLVSAACGGELPWRGDPDPLPRPSVAALDEEIASWDATRNTLVAGSAGPFTLIGLCHLAPSNLPARLGGDPDTDCAIPSSHAPALLGTLAMRGDSLVLESPAPLFWIGPKPLREAHVLALREQPEVDGAAAWFGPVRVAGQWSASGISVALVDTLAPARAAFRGIARWPVDTAWWFPATFTPAAPDWREVPTVRGFDLPQRVAGTVTVVRGGDTLHLEAWSRGRRGQAMLMVIRDGTSGDGSYAAGRFVDVPLPDALGRTVVDFNRARNPDCAFTPASACPLPPPSNRLPFAVTAGERAWGPATP